MKNYIYIIHFKERDKEYWGKTSYTSPQPVTREYLIRFFGLEECEDYLIEDNN